MDWFWEMEAAHYCHVPPWELARQPVHWREHALAVVRIKQETENARMSKMFGGNT